MLRLCHQMLLDDFPTHRLVISQVTSNLRDSPLLRDSALKISEHRILVILLDPIAINSSVIRDNVDLWTRCVQVLKRGVAEVRSIAEAVILRRLRHQILPNDLPTPRLVFVN